MAYEKGSRPEGGFKRRGPARRRKKVCVFCGKENNEINYKDVAVIMLGTNDCAKNGENNVAATGSTSNGAISVTEFKNRLLWCDLIK